MNLLQSIIYGFVSGLSEFMPASSRAHQAIMLKLFGSQQDPVMDLLVHIAILVALYMSCRNQFDLILRERRITTRRTRLQSSRSYLYPFIRSASLTLVLVFAVLTYISGQKFTMIVVSVFCLINGVFLFVPDRLIQSNKTAQHMSGLDSVLLGIFSALSVYPGISRIGASNAYSISRGADRQHAYDWSLIISFPAIVLLIILDFIGIFTAALPVTFLVILGYIIAVAFAYLGAYLSISFVRFLAVKVGFSTFAYYSWGMALFTFILYLI